MNNKAPPLKETFKIERKCHFNQRFTTNKRKTEKQNDFEINSHFKVNKQINTKFSQPLKLSNVGSAQ